GADQFGHLGFHRGRRAVGQAVIQLATDGIKYVGVAVAENHRPPGANVINVALVVFINDVGAFGVLDEQGRAANAAKCTNRGVNTTGNMFLGTGKKGFGAGHGQLSQGIKAVKSSARRRTSAADSTPNSPCTTASRSAPASRSGGALFSV